MEIQERRALQRWEINKEGVIRMEGAEADAKCFILDINLRGTRICFPQCLKKDTLVRFKYCIGRECNISVEGWVVWHKRVEGTNVYGIYFTRINEPDKNRVYHFMLRNYPNHVYKKAGDAIMKEEKGGKKMTDQRVFERIPAELPMRFIDNRHNLEGDALAYDISAKGLGMVADINLAPQTPLEIWLKTADSKEPVYTRGEVVWSKEVDDKYRIGVNLEQADLMGLARVLRPA